MIMTTVRKILNWLRGCDQSVASVEQLRVVGFICSTSDDGGTITHGNIWESTDKYGTTLFVKQRNSPVIIHLGNRDKFKDALRAKFGTDAIILYNDTRLGIPDQSFYIGVLKILNAINIKLRR